MTVHLAAYGIDAFREGNLRKLAAHLLTLPADYPDFAMSKFTTGEGGASWDEAHLPTCGTAACAAGHGPGAGIAPVSGEDWDDYSARAFIPKGAAWHWCFHGWWSDVDNTAHGAAHRILWLLEHGLPENSHAQMRGGAPLCYAVPA